MAYSNKQFDAEMTLKVILKLKVRFGCKIFRSLGFRSQKYGLLLKTQFNFEGHTKGKGQGNIPT